MDNKQPVCALCGNPMPEGEEMFKYHGYSAPCSDFSDAKKQQILEAEEDE
jgi:hypothetical protein